MITPEQALNNIKIMAQAYVGTFKQHEGMQEAIYVLEALVKAQDPQPTEPKLVPAPKKLKKVE